MTNDTRLHRLFARARLDDREVNELLGISHGIIADGVISPAEVEYLQKWLIAHTAAAENPVIVSLLDQVDRILADGKVDPEEAAELLAVLKAFCGGEFEHGELLKSSSLPLDEPPPEIVFPGSRFSFTGTFAFGTRNDCETAAHSRGATSGSLTRETRYLVVGVYATDSWAHSTFGRKIEKAVEMRSQGVPIAIVGESHWVEFVRRD